MKGLFKQIVRDVFILRDSKSKESCDRWDKDQGECERGINFGDREWLDKREKEEIEAIEEAFKKMDEIDEEEDRIFGVDKREMNFLKI